MGTRILTVEDDGCGFDPNRSAADAQYGLLGMRERASMIGGCLTVESQVGKGTQIIFHMGATNDQGGAGNDSPAHL